MAEVKKSIPKRRFVGKKNRKENNLDGSNRDVENAALVTINSKRSAGRVATQIPEDILNDKAINEAIKLVSCFY